MSRKYRFGLPAPGLIAPGLVPALLAGPPTAFVTAARWTMRAGLVAAALGLAIILPTLSAGPAAAQDEGAATSTTPAFATSTPGFAPDSKDKPGPATVIVERCFEDRETGEVTCTESTEPAGVLIEQTTGPRGCYFDDLGDYICYEEVSISDLLMTLDQGGEDAFTVKGSDLLLGYTYELRVKRESGNSNIGFSAVCDGVQVTVEVPAFSANRHSYSHDFTLHGCCPPGGTVTAEVLRNGSVVATREKEVTVLGPEVSISARQSSVTEGDDIMFDVTANPAPKSDLKVDVSVTESGFFITGLRPRSVTIPENGSTASFTVRTRNDRVDESDGSVTASIREDEDELYVVGSPSSKTVTVKDNDVKVSFSSSTYTVNQGSVGAVTVRLSEASDQRLSIPIVVTAGSAESGDYRVTGLTSSGELTFSAGSTSRTFNIVANYDLDDDNETVDLEFDSDDLPYDVMEGTPSSSRVTIIDPDVLVSFEQSSYRVVEGSSVSVKVILSKAPGSSVTISLTRTNQGTTSNSDYSGVPSRVIFNRGDKDESFTFRATQDSVDDDGESVKLGFESLPTGVIVGTPRETTISIIDDDEANLVVDPATLRVDEDGTGTFTVKLATRPTASVTVSVSSGDTDAATVSASSLVFTTSNWNGAKTVTVSGVDDDDATDETVTVSLRASSTDSDYRGKTGSVGVSVIDDDTPNLVVDPATLRVNEDGTGTFTVKLATRPTASVTVSVSSGDTDAATVSASSLVFTTSNWNGAKTVTVSGVDDDDATDETVTVSLRASSTDSDYRGKTGSVGVSVIDDDTPNLVVDPATLRVDEDGTGTFTVKLATRPTASVTVSVSSGDTDAATVSASSLVFTTSNWNGAKTVTVSGVDDDDATDETVTVSLRASSTDSDYRGKTGSVGVSVIDDDSDYRGEDRIGGGLGHRRRHPEPGG